jgi:Protein of unknown function (DUF3631)
MSRTIRILMLPDIEDLSEESDWEFVEEEAHALASRLEAWADSVREVIKQTVVDLPEGCTRCARERWRPLKRIAEIAGGDWPATSDKLIVRNLAEEAAEREDGLRARPPGMVLLVDLHAVWPADQKFVATSDLVHRLVAHDPDYWGADSPYGKTLTEHRFGRLLSQAAKVTSQQEVTSQRPGGTGPRGFLRSQLEPVWKRLGMIRSHETEDPPEPSGESDESGESGDQQIYPDQKPQVTASTVSTASTALPPEVGQVAHFAEHCLDCGTELTAEEAAIDHYACAQHRDGQGASDG